MGVVSFAFVAILGMVPAGLTTFRRAMNTSIQANIAQNIVNQVVAGDYSQVTGQYYFDGEGVQLADNTGAIFTANVSTSSPTSNDAQNSQKLILSTKGTKATIQIIAPMMTNTYAILMPTP